MLREIKYEECDNAKTNPSFMFRFPAGLFFLEKKKKKNPFFYIHPLLFSPLAIDVNLSCAFLLVALFTHASNANEVVYILQKSIRFF